MHLALVLDPAALISSSGETAVLPLAEHLGLGSNAAARTYDGGAGASLKMLEAAQAEQAKAQAQEQLAAARFALNWGPLAALPAAARQKVIDASMSGRGLLLRADLPGRHSVGELPSKALLDVDGVQVPGRVLGVLRQTSELQSVGLLIDVANAPQGLGPGARTQVVLMTATRSGLLLPRDALLYDENGTYVYKQLAKKSAGDAAIYAPVKVNLLLPLGKRLLW